MNTAEKWIRELGLQRHPEGGYFAETYRSAETIAAEALPDRFDGRRALSTAIYFLLTEDDFSAFHRLKSDELWHFYAGDPLAVHVIEPDGVYRKILLGNRFGVEEVPQSIVSAGAWFATELVSPGGYALTGCTVAPGFDFSDFDLADRDELVSLFPSHANVIQRLTRPPSKAF